MTWVPVGVCALVIVGLYIALWEASCVMSELNAKIRKLRRTDTLRRIELADTDAALTAAERRYREQKELARALAERVAGQSEALSHLAEKKPVVISEDSYCPLGSLDGDLEI
jgi:hypothetical protein